MPPVWEPQQDNGLRQRLFGYLPAKSATKTALTATTISDTAPVTISNYNDVSGREALCLRRSLAQLLSDLLLQ